MPSGFRNQWRKVSAIPLPIHDVEDAMAKDDHEASCTYARARVVGHYSGLVSDVRSNIVYASYITVHICYSVYLTYRGTGK